MNKKWFCVILVIVLAFAIGGSLHYKTIDQKYVSTLDSNEISGKKETEDGKIVPIPVASIKGITAKEAEELCHTVLGDRDEETGFIFSFGTSGAVEKDKKQYYVIRASWLVNNSHMSYIGDFFVSADGKEIYSGVALHDEYTMENKIWSE